MRFIRAHSERLKSLPPRQKQSEAECELYDIIRIQLSLAYSMKGDLEYAIKMLEGYLPLKDREFSNREHASIVRKRIDKRSIDGVNPDGELLYAPHCTEEGIEELFKFDISSDIIECTTKRQRLMLFGCLYFNRTQDELAQLYNISQPTVHEHIKIACNNIRQTLQDKYGVEECEDLCIAPINIDKIIDNEDQNVLTKTII